MIPNITNEIVLQLKDLKPGSCIAFGVAFRVPLAIKIDIPNPRPLSDNVNINDVWYNTYTNVNNVSTPTVNETYEAAVINKIIDINNNPTSENQNFVSNVDTTTEQV